MTAPDQPQPARQPRSAQPVQPVQPAQPLSHAEWQQLDRRTITASTVLVAGALAAAAVPAAIGMLISGLGIGWVLLWTIGGLVVGTAGTAIAEAIRLAVTRFRVDPHRIERRVRFLASTTTSIATARIRNVEISADLVQRRMGIATVKLSSGETDGSRLTLAALDLRHAEDLRRRLLADRASTDGAEVVHVDPGWVRYAPASIMTPLFGLIAAGVVLQVADWFNAAPELLRWIWARVQDIPIPLLVISVLVAACVIGAAVSAVMFVENWWQMRLDHHRDGSLEMRRGLLVGRHTTLDGSRVRGMTLHEPPGFRLLGAARLDVVAIGVGIGKDEDGKTKPSPALVPAAPRQVSVDVAESILPATGPVLTSDAVATNGAQGAVSLVPHPPVARRRRLGRALATTVALTAIALVPALVWSWLWWIPVVVAAISGAVSVWIALDNFRGLGHAVTGQAVALRKGSVFRRTDVLTRDGILGWNVRRTPFQRRAGLVTLIATSAAGSGAFRLPDVSHREAEQVWRTAGDVWDHLAVQTD